MDITAEKLRELLHYDTETGVFRWLGLSAPGSQIRAGDVAGSINSDSYRRIRVDGRLYAAHRLAFLWMNGEWPKKDIDHQNKDKTDNRWTNLREVTRSRLRTGA